MRAIPTSAAALVTVLAAPVAAHDCFKPPPPPVADKNTLTLEQRNATTAAIDAYIAQVNVYLACLERSDAAARAEVEQIIEIWEAPVKDLEIVQ